MGKFTLILQVLAFLASAYLFVAVPLGSTVYASIYYLRGNDPADVLNAWVGAFQFGWGISPLLFILGIIYASGESK